MIFFARSLINELNYIIIIIVIIFKEYKIEYLKFFP